MSSGGIFVTDNKNAIPFRIEFLNIIISKRNSTHVGIILDGIIGSSDPEVLVDQVSNLSSAKETVLFFFFAFLLDDSVQC